MPVRAEANSQYMIGEKLYYALAKRHSILAGLANSAMPIMSSIRNHFAAVVLQWWKRDRAFKQGRV
jgi:hypothetical protein